MPERRASIICLEEKSDILRTSQKNYLHGVLLEEKERIEREAPLAEEETIDFKAPVQHKYRSSKENSTIYSINMPVSLLSWFDRVCERDNVTFSTLVDEALTKRREAFLQEQKKP